MTTIIDTFLVNAWLAGIGISLMSAPMGCFIAWQRLVYFGDTVAHAALLGVVLALCFSVSPVIGIVIMAILISVIVASAQNEYLLPSDTLLGIAAHGSLALGLVILSLSPTITFDVNGLLFGDILAAGTQDVILIFSMAFITIALLIANWKKLMRYVLHADIAEVEGVNTKHMRLMLMLLIALIVALSIKLVGILLITSLLILPAAAARFLARSPSHMAVCATVLSMVAVTLGLYASVQFDTPTGPSIILAALSLLLLVSVFRRRIL